MKAGETAIVFIEFQNDFCREGGALYGGVKDQIKARIPSRMLKTASRRPEVNV